MIARQVEVYLVRSWQTNKFSFNEDNPLGEKVQLKVPSSPAPTSQLFKRWRKTRPEFRVPYIVTHEQKCLKKGSFRHQTCYSSQWSHFIWVCFLSSCFSTRTLWHLPCLPLNTFHGHSCSSSAICDLDWKLKTSMLASLDFSKIFGGYINWRLYSVYIVRRRVYIYTEQSFSLYVAVTCWWQYCSSADVQWRRALPYIAFQA